MMAAQDLANGISYSGHMYAMTRAGRFLTPAGELLEKFGGMEQVSVQPVWGQRSVARGTVARFSTEKQQQPDYLKIYL